MLSADHEVYPTGIRVTVLPHSLQGFGLEVSFTSKTELTLLMGFAKLLLGKMSIPALIIFVHKTVPLPPRGSFSS